MAPPSQEGGGGEEVEVDASTTMPQQSNAAAAPQAPNADDVEAAGKGDDDNATDNAAQKDTRRHMIVAADAPWGERMWEVFSTFWPLGLVAFGGPQAHVAILRDHLVVQRDWLDEEQFTELFAIGQVRSFDCVVVLDFFFWQFSCDLISFSRSILPSTMYFD